MDNVHDLPQVESVEHASVDLRDLGLQRLTPINPLTFSRMDWLWEKLKSQDYAFTDFTRGDLDVFAAGMMDAGSLHFLVGESGYVVVRNLRYSDDPSLHYCVWDRGLAFKEILKCGREIVDFLFKRLKVARISAQVPIYNEQAGKFAKLLGFRFEGEIRNGILYHERHYNVTMYGLLRSEWERGTITKG